jgi:AcrR family transcriptional regulator
MDNPSRSERSRNAVLTAAITIIARDGPGRLTLDAIARESGLSKGGLMHQFRSKQAVLKALLRQQMTYFEEIGNRFLEKARATSSQPELAAQIATMQEAVAQPNSVAFAMAAVIAEDPSLLAGPRKIDAQIIKAIKARAADPELALLRWAAARGLLLNTLFGMSPLSDKERDRLFARLLDDRQWTALEPPGKGRATGPVGARTAKALAARKRV